MSTALSVQKIDLVPVSPENLETYLQVGKTSYCQHYLHLWKNEDPSPYINHGLTKEVVLQEIANSNALNYLINQENTTVGILKLVKDCGIDELTDEEALKAEKIYFLKEHSGKGYGKQVLQFIEDMATKLGKKYVWLDAMQKGNPIFFYQKNGYKIKRESEVTLPNAKPEEKPMWILTKAL